jgi:hypothetical protein
MVVLDVETLKQHLDYDPATGVFTRKQTETFNPKVRVGGPAGHLNSDGYVYIRVLKKSYLAHRLAWLFMHGHWPSEIDHVNGTKSDNSFKNLRESTRSQNMANTVKPKHNSSGVKGVCFDKTNGKWLAYIMVNKRLRNLGRFDSFDEAVEKRKVEAERVFGEFARA